MIPPTYYLVLDFGRAGRESVINWERSTKEDVIYDILSGDHGGRLYEVHCIDRDVNRWDDVTEEIAREVWDRITDRPRVELIEFLEDKLGLVKGIA